MQEGRLLRDTHIANCVSQPTPLAHRAAPSSQIPSNQQDPQVINRGAQFPLQPLEASKFYIPSA